MWLLSKGDKGHLAAKLLHPSGYTQEPRVGCISREGDIEKTSETLTTITCRAISTAVSLTPFPESCLLSSDTTKEPTAPTANQYEHCTGDHDSWSRVYGAIRVS
jgi:hypothetical protein